MKLVIILVIFIFAFLYFFPIIEIVGNSMYPTYKDKEHILGRRIFSKNTNIKVGDVIVFKIPDEDKILIKRVVNIHKEIYHNRYSYFVLGDNINYSNDSRNFGWVDSEYLIAKVLRPRKLEVDNNGG